LSSVFAQILGHDSWGNLLCIAKSKEGPYTFKMPATIITTSNADDIKTRLSGKKIAIFAATLNPPTVGHDEMIDQLLAQKNDHGIHAYDFVYIHTTENSPTGHYKPDTGDYAVRHAMSRLSFQTKERVLLSDLPPLETVSLLMHVSDVSVAHIIGSDSMGWLQAVSDRADAVFFRGTPHNRPTATVTDPDTGEACLFSGRGIYEICTEKLVITQREALEIPAVFLGIPTERFVLDVNRGMAGDVSSNRIRALVKEGRADEAKEILAPGLRENFDAFLSSYLR